MSRLLFLLSFVGGGVMVVYAQSGKGARVVDAVGVVRRAETARRLVSGMVSGEGSGPLEGVTVSVKGGGVVSGSQQDGQYYIEIPVDDSVLVFSLEGYQTREVQLTDETDYSVVLKPVAGGFDVAQVSVPFSAMGPWRGVFEVRPGLEVPFNFEVRADSGDRALVFFRNADEWFEGGRVVLTTDSFYIELDQFDNELAFPIGRGSLEGVLRRQDKTGNPLRVRIEPGSSYRFADSGIAAAGDMSGTYDVTFGGSGYSRLDLSFPDVDGRLVSLIRYTQVFGGLADKQAVAASLPALNTFLAFPTTLFIDRQGRVAAIHTGFNGPATGRYYQDFIKEFNEEIDALLK